MIAAVLNDAQEKQLMDRAVRIWLDNHQDLAYDVEDILDEFATEALGPKLMAEHWSSTSKVRNLIPACFKSLSPSAIKFNVSMGSKIRDITSRLEELHMQSDVLGLKEIARGTATALHRRLSSSIVPVEPNVYGRDEDKAKVLEMVLSDELIGANFHVISIVGMPGIGKTTLA